MRFISSFAVALTMAGIAAPALADAPKIYPVHSKHNYCPAGLQPITISGVICCGTPNQDMSYTQVMAHPVQKARHHHTPRQRHVDTCREGEKGCF